MAKKPMKYCVVDAFTDKAFKGNPAAVCLLDEAKDDEWLQSVAAEFNVSVTCYLTDSNEPATNSNPRFCLRWFSPVVEVDLCGHATLAAAHFLFYYGFVKTDDTIEFSTTSGILTAKRVQASASSFSHDQGDYLIELDFPLVQIAETDLADAPAISKILNGASVLEINKTSKNDLFILLPSGEAVTELRPQFDLIRNIPHRGMIITGPAPQGSHFDFYSRFFYPKQRVDEDPVCGSAHCVLAPYWRKKLGKCDLVALAASPRVGVLKLLLDEENQRVFLRGKAVAVMEGSLLV